VIPRGWTSPPKKKQLRRLTANLKELN